MGSVLVSSHCLWQNLFLCQAPSIRIPGWLTFLCPGGGVEEKGSGRGSLGGGCTQVMWRERSPDLGQA